MYNKDALTAAFSLAYLEIRSRNEEAINSTLNRIYSLKVFHFLLYHRRYRGHRLYTCINTQNFKGLDSTEITSLPEIQKVIHMAHYFNHRQK